MASNNKRKFIDSAEAYESISSLGVSVSMLASLAYRHETSHSIKGSKSADKIHNTQVRELEGSILNSINGVLKKWTNISGNGGNAYAMSRNSTQAKRKLALNPVKENKIYCMLPINRCKLAPDPHTTPSMKDGLIPSRNPPSHGKVYSPGTAVQNVVKEAPDLQTAIIESMIQEKQIPIQFNRMATLVRDHNKAILANKPSSDVVRCNRLLIDS